MSVRAARAGDVAMIAVLEEECFPGDAWTEDYLRIAVDGGMATVRILVAERARRVVGHAIVSVVYEIAELQRLGVTAPARRRGLASELLDASLAHARDEGAERLLLEVREENTDALAFYARARFTEIDRREHYYRDGSTAIVLQRDLAEGTGAVPPP